MYIIINNVVKKLIVHHSPDDEKYKHIKVYVRKCQGGHKKIWVRTL